MLTLLTVDPPQICSDTSEAVPAQLSRRWLAAIIVGLFLASLPLRLMNLQAPFTGEHEFRQTQTALSVWEIREHGFSLMHPKLPLFGPPWECPFEYPVFQIVAAAVDSIAPWNNLDVSIRLTNLVFFYLTALALAVLARMLFQDSAVVLLTTVVFLFSPYNTHWSRSSMIEFAATFFGLAYLVAFIRWTLCHRPMCFSACLILGILGCLTKATSFVIPLAVAATLGLLQVLPSMRYFLARCRSAPCLQVSNEEVPLAPVFATAVLVAIPLLVGFWYVHFGDLIKEQAPYTAWLSSRHPYTRTWTYGTWAQRLQVHNWATLWRRMQYSVLPEFSFALIVGWLALPFRVRAGKLSATGKRLLGGSIVIAPVLVVFLFFNLFVIHSYYMVACSPFLALFAGVGLGVVYSLARTRMLRLALVLLLAGVELQEWSGRYGEMLGAPATTDARVSWLTEAARAIDKDEPVIILSSTEWSAFAPYYLKRRAFMAMLVKKPVDIEPLLHQNYFKNHGFHWLLIEGNDSRLSEYAARIKNQWKIARQMHVAGGDLGYTLYWLSDAEPVS